MVAELVGRVPVPNFTNAWFGECTSKKTNVMINLADIPARFENIDISELLPFNNRIIKRMVQFHLNISSGR